MFSIFRRKLFLADYLHGLIDIHNHILPGIDDGAETPGDSIAMIKSFAEFGITNFVCTPHIMNHYYPNTPKTIKDSFELLTDRLSQQGMDNVKLDFAAEHMIDDAFEGLLEDNLIVPLKQDYLLIEMSYLQPFLQFDKSVRKIIAHRYFPLLAHPERYIYYHKKYHEYNEMKSQGISFQLNLLSLGGYYGKDIQRVAIKMMDDQLIDYVASDVHNLKQLEALKEIRIPSQVLSNLLPIIENTIVNFH